jgi:hypothetical protein
MIIGKNSRSTSKWFSRSILAAVLSSIGWLGGLTPSISFQSQSLVEFNSAASAQNANPLNLTPDQLRSYAQSLLQIEPLRQQYYESIKQELQQSEPGQAVPAITCSDRNSLNDLPRPIRGTAVEYCEKSIEIVEANNLTIEEFNDITESLTTDQNLMNLITQQLLQLQMQNNNLFQ